MTFPRVDRVRARIEIAYPGHGITRQIEIEHGVLGDDTQNADPAALRRR